MPSAITLEGFEDVTPSAPPRLEIEGFDDVTPFLGRAEDPAPTPSPKGVEILGPADSITGPLIDTPRQKRRKQIEEFNAIPNIADNPLTSSEFGRGVAKGALGMGETYLGFGEALADIIGADAAKEWLKEKGDKLAEMQQAIPQRVDDFTDIDLTSSDGLSDLGAYIAMSIGKVAPQFATGALGGVLARGSAKGVELAKRMAAVGVATAYPQEAGGIYRGIRDETGKEAPWTALTAGAASAALEALPEARLLTKIFGGEAGEVLKREGWKGLVKASVGEVAKTGALGQVTEMGQESIALLANKFADETYPLLTAKNGIRILDAGLQGFIGEGAMGGAATAIGGLLPPPDAPPAATPKVAPPASLGETLGGAPRPPEPAPTFYSRLQRAVEDSKQQKASGAQWKASIRQSKTGINVDEFDLVGVDSLEDAKPYTKAEVLTFLKDNEVQVKEVVLGGQHPEQQAALAEFDRLNNEWFSVTNDNSPMTMPEEQFSETVRRRLEIGEQIRKLQDDFKAKFGFSIADENPNPKPHYPGRVLGGGEEGTYREWVLSVPEQSREQISQRLHKMPYDQLPPVQMGYVNHAFDKGLEDWKDGHGAYDAYPNVIVRLRGNVHTTVDGKKMFLIEELQAPSSKTGDFAKMPAFFQKNWRSIGLKFGLRKAAELGVDQLGWTTGTQQSKRGGLGAELSRIEWHYNALMQEFRIDGYSRTDPNNRVVSQSSISKDKLEAYVGKDVARQILESPQVVEADTHKDKDVLDSGAHKALVDGAIEGDNLSVGGAGLRRLYDQDLRNTIHSLPNVKKAGVKVGTAGVQIGETEDYSHITADQVDARIRELRRLHRANPEDPQWNSGLDSAAVGMVRYMSEGVPYKAALYRSGGMQALAEYLGFQAKVAPDIATVWSIPVPADLKASVLQSQPLGGSPRKIPTVTPEQQARYEAEFGKPEAAKPPSKTAIKKANAMREALVKLRQSEYEAEQRMGNATTQFEAEMRATLPRPIGRDRVAAYTARITKEREAIAAIRVEAQRIAGEMGQLGAAPRTSVVTPEQDAEYMAAVQRGDTATAQRMVDEAAKRAGRIVGSTQRAKGKFYREGLLIGERHGDYGPGEVERYTDAFSDPESRRSTADMDKRDYLSLWLSEELFNNRGPGDSLSEKEPRKRWVQAREAAIEWLKGAKTAKDTQAIIDEWVTQANAHPWALQDGEAGNIIPLSQRFNPASPDIRYFQPRPVSPPTATAPQQPRVITSVEEALSVLSDPASGIDRNVARALTSVLSTPGLQKAAEALGFKLNLLDATNALLGRAEGTYDPVTDTMMLAYNATDPLIGPHEVAHKMERFLTDKQRALIRRERTAAIAATLKRKNLTPQQREFLGRISDQERTSQWFGAAMDELGVSILELYPLVNGSEFFAQSFSSWFQNKNHASPGYRSFIAQVKEFLSKIYDALRRAFGVQWNLEEIHRRLINGQFDVTVDGGVLNEGRDALGGAASQPGGRLTPAAKKMIQRFMDAAREVSSRKQYGTRDVVAAAKSFMATWSNGSGAWFLGQPRRINNPIIPTKGSDEAARQRFREAYPKGMPHFVNAGEEVRLDANQILVEANSVKEAAFIADRLPTLPLFAFASENNPLLQSPQQGQEFVERMENIAKFYGDLETLATDPVDVIAAVDAFIGDVVAESTPGPLLGSAPRPQFFKDRDAADAAMTRHRLSPEALAEAQRLADVQGGIVPAATLTRINALPASRDTPEGYAKKRLEFVVDMAGVSDTPVSASTLPRTTPEEQRQAVVASQQVLEHDNVIKGNITTLEAEINEKGNELAEFMAKNSAKATTQNLKAEFLDRTTERLIRDFGLHVQNLIKTAAASKVYDAAADLAIRRLADSVNVYTRNPGGLSQAIEKITDALPANTFIQGGITPQDIVNWLTNPTQAALVRSLGAANEAFLITNGALAQYPQLVQKLATIHFIKQDRVAAQLEMDAFRAHFATLHAGGPHATPGAIAKAYHKFATQSKRATEIATGIEDTIDKLDREVRGSMLAVEILNEMIQAPGYQANMAIAMQDVDPIVRDMMGSGGTGFVTYKGPISGTMYKVDLMPGKAQEQENLQQLANFIFEIDQYLDPAVTPNPDPILARSYAAISAYLKSHMMNPWFSPENSGLRRWWKLNFFGRPVRIPIGLFTGLPKAFFRAIGIPTLSAQTLLERIGGRAGSIAVKEWQQANYVLTQFRVINENADYGIYAINLKNLQAAVAHGFQNAPFGVQQWQTYVAEPIIASRQNSLGLPLVPGKKIYGYTITALDMEAIAKMKQYEDETAKVVQRNPSGHTLQTFNPVRTTTATLAGGRQGTRLLVAYGPSVMARRFSNFGRGWVRAWSEAGTDAAKLKLLETDHNFKMVALGMVQETNPEYKGQSKDKTQAEMYRLIAGEMYHNNLEFTDIGQLLWHIAGMRYQALGVHQNTSYAHERQSAQDSLIADIDAFTKSYNNQIEENEPWTKDTGIPPTIQQVTAASNSFTQGRKDLVAPSTFYSYGIASDADKALFQHQARQVFQLRQIEAMENLLHVLQAKQAEWRERIAALQRTGLSSRSATNIVKAETQASFEQGEFLAEWSDLNEMIKDLHVTLDNVKRIAAQSADKYYSQTLGFVMSTQQTLASSLLSGLSPIWNNWSGATVVSTGLVDAQLGEWNPILLGGKVIRRGGRTAAMALRQLASIKNRGIVRVLGRHGPALSRIGDLIDDFVQLHADNNAAAKRIGAVAPYQLKQRLKLQSVFKGTGGRVEFTDPNVAMWALSGFTSWPGIRHLIEGMKYTMPRITDQLSNMSNVSEIQRKLEDLKRIAIRSWSAREATGSPNWRDTHTKAGLLSPKELGVDTLGAARRFRDFFSPVGQIEVITQRYYMEQKTNPNAEILTEGEREALLLEYLKVTNLAVEGNRPHALTGSQTRTLFGLFRGWPSEMLEQINKLFLQHKGDEKGKEAVLAITAIIMFALMAAIVGAFNRELLYEAKELWTGETSKDIRFPALVESGDPKELLRYTFLAWAGTLPYISEVANRALGGTSSRPLTDLTAIVPVLGLAQGAFDAAERTLVTGDPIYPMVDFIRRWVPVSQPILNRLPGIEGDIASRNATRALQAAVPSGMEIREQTGGRFRGTAMTPILRDIVSAAYTGDDTKMNEAIARGIAMKEAEGALDGAAELAANLRGYMPERRLFGRELTATEEARLIARMTERQQDHYERSRQAFSAIDAKLEGLKTGVRAPRSATSTRTRRSRFTSRRGRRLSLGRSRLGSRLGSRRRRRRLRL